MAPCVCHRDISCLSQKCLSCEVKNTWLSWVQTINRTVIPVVACCHLLAKKYMYNCIHLHLYVYECHKSLYRVLCLICSYVSLNKAKQHFNLCAKKSGECELSIGLIDFRPTQLLTVLCLCIPPSWLPWHFSSHLPLIVCVCVCVCVFVCLCVHHWLLFKINSWIKKQQSIFQQRSCSKLSI